MSEANVLTDFRLSIDGFEDEMHIPHTDNGCEHVSAYSAARKIEIALLNHLPEGFKLLVSRPENGRGYNGVIPTPGNTKVHEIMFSQFDPLTIRCTAMEMIKEMR